MPLEPSHDGTLRQVNDLNTFAVRPRSNVVFPALKTHMLEEFDRSQGLGVNGKLFADLYTGVDRIDGAQTIFTGIGATRPIAGAPVYGTLDLADIVAFVELFSFGCP